MTTQGADAQALYKQDMNEMTTNEQATIVR